MTDQADLLTQFSNALAARAEASKKAVVAVRLAHERHNTGMVWRSGIVVVSEQSLPTHDDNAGRARYSTQASKLDKTQFWPVANGRGTTLTP